MPCLWKHFSEIEQYQSVIPPGRTLAVMADVEQDRAFVQIVEQILSMFQVEAERQPREREVVVCKAEEERSARERLQREKPDRSPAPPRPKRSPAPPSLRLRVQAGSMLQEGYGLLGTAEVAGCYQSGGGGGLQGGASKWQSQITQAQWQVVGGWERVERELDPDLSKLDPNMQQRS